eukprot:12920669-Prorocentrum_lima.AAC.1
MDVLPVWNHSDAYVVDLDTLLMDHAFVFISPVILGLHAPPHGLPNLERVESPPLPEHGKRRPCATTATLFPHVGSRGP